MVEISKAVSGKVVPGAKVTVTASEFASALGIRPKSLTIRQAGAIPVRMGHQQPQSKCPDTIVVSRDGAKIVSQVFNK